MSKVKKIAHSENVSSSSDTSTSPSSGDEIDAQDLKPIRDYLSNRRELARQLFKSVKADKIQMMLPQVLRKMDFEQLEEWCANELSGMSKARILCILKGKAMVESSDTTESDDSGPSLEIISDTEEWFTDEDIIKQEEGMQSLKAKVKKDKVKQKGKSLHKRSDSKLNHKKVPDNIYKNIQIKKEEQAEISKEKEGDSLLDLLELEMRARAIRALIRKEEDIIPNASKSKGSDNAATGTAVSKAEQEEMKEKENCRRQLERIISAQQSSTAEDEDVVLVVQPTPTIELLSSESDGESHGGVRINKKLENERVMNTKDNIEGAKNEDTNNIHNVNSIEKLKENEVSKNGTESHKELDTLKTDISKRVHSNNIANNDTQSKSNGKRRKMKKKLHTKEESKNASSKIDMQKEKSRSESQHTKSVKKDKCLSVDDVPENIKLNGNEQENDIKSTVIYNNSTKNKNSGEAINIQKKILLDEEKSIDLDEIIDLDNYCDDMDDIESSENDKNKNKVTTKSGDSKFQAGMCSTQKTNGPETWASRYYQTDDVQNVIKESKIQSEIRKRLRERQRLSKLSTSPNTNSLSSSPIIETGTKIGMKKDPLGSVNEYLALKQTTATSLGTTDNNTDSSILKDKDAFSITCTDTSSVIESSSTSIVHSEEHNVNKETDLGDNANIDNSSMIKKDKLTSAIISTHSD
ncbi:uncharacterized protein LOC128891211 isoform X1 [Hylaeus anthracinus]|uniref:uncharacterized protein LOC128891211 isoform X1 n=1 Tax=Hylaeus anthracinus TaxID=313031 RepID=UPI0023B93E8B|nr:uncharacterized protein LOC128891211 isoform X1 [Hylaeus anthracinus]